MALALEPRANRILAALPQTELRRWQHELEPVELSLGQALFEPGKAPAHLYFPATAIVSLMYFVDGDVQAEIASVGREGVAGVVLLMGDEVAPSRAVVQRAGLAYRLDGQALKHGARRAPVLPLVLRFTQALITQMAQTAVCNRHHSLDQRLCRWLLARLDRVPGSELVMTHESVAAMLGVRREDVTETASILQGEGLIRYSRGSIRVLDREALRLRACECYAVVKKEYDRLLPPGRAAA